MARTSQEIEQELDSQIVQYEELSELHNNTSMMQFWKYCKKIIVFVVLAIEKIFDKHKLEVLNTIDQTETGSIEWYAYKIGQYQHGDSLIIDNNRAKYPVIDISKQIVSRVAMIENLDASLTAKAVKQVGDELEPLDGSELAGLKTYINRIKIAGTKVNMVSLPADELLIKCSVILNPLTFDEDGKLISDGSEPVRDEMNDFLKNFAFGSTLIRPLQGCFIKKSINKLS